LILNYYYYYFLFFIFYFYFFLKNLSKDQKEQNKALTLYLRNVIQKMMSDPHLEEVEDSRYMKPTRPRRHSRSVSYFQNKISEFFAQKEANNNNNKNNNKK